MIPYIALIAIIGILAWITAPRFIAELKLGRETAAINSLRTIHKMEMQFKEQNHRFATLEELCESGLLDRIYAKGVSVNQYVYKSIEARPDKYCVQATRQSESSGYRDFNVIEDGTIRYTEVKAPAPIPHGEGIQLGDVPATEGTSAGAAGQQPKP
jgi:Tfp pilus assembly protein PilE